MNSMARYLPRTKEFFQEQEKHPSLHIRDCKGFQSAELIESMSHYHNIQFLINIVVDFNISLKLINPDFRYLFELVVKSLFLEVSFSKQTVESKRIMEFLF